MTSKDLDWSDYEADGRRMQRMHEEQLERRYAAVVDLVRLNASNGEDQESICQNLYVLIEDAEGRGMVLTAIEEVFS